MWSKRILVAALGAVLWLQVGAAAATTPAAPRVKVGTGARAQFDVGGVGVLMRVAGVCSPGAVVIQSYVYVVQDGYPTESAHIPLRCDGTLHRSVVLVPMADVVLHSGPATSEAFALVRDPVTGVTAQDDRTRDITILP